MYTSTITYYYNLKGKLKFNKNIFHVLNVLIAWILIWCIDPNILVNFLRLSEIRKEVVMTKIGRLSTFKTFIHTLIFVFKSENNGIKIILIYISINTDKPCPVLPVLGNLSNILQGEKWTYYFDVFRWLCVHWHCTFALTIY